MRKLIVTNIVSLDGYVDGPGGNPMALPMDHSFDAYNAERLRRQPPPVPPLPPRPQRTEPPVSRRSSPRQRAPAAERASRGSGSRAGSR
jgi:hypothetical protein